MHDAHSTTHGELCRVACIVYREARAGGLFGAYFLKVWYNINIIHVTHIIKHLTSSLLTRLFICYRLHVTCSMTQSYDKSTALSSGDSRELAIGLAPQITLDIWVICRFFGADGHA